PVDVGVRGAHHGHAPLNEEYSTLFAPRAKPETQVGSPDASDGKSEQPSTSPCSTSEKPQPLLAGSNQWPLWSISLITPEAISGWMVHVPCLPPMSKLTSAASALRKAIRNDPTVLGGCFWPLLHRCL